MKIKYSTRFVILTKTSAYKIPLSYRGYLQGVNEGKIYTRYKDECKMLAKLKWEFLGIVCQQRIKHVDSIDPEFVLMIKEAIPEFNFDNCDLYNKDNWGILNEKILLLDYGIDEAISKMY